MIDYMTERLSFGAWRLTILEDDGPYRVYVDNQLLIETSDADEQDSYIFETLSDFEPYIEIVTLADYNAGHIPDAEYFGPFASLHVRTPSPDLLPDLPEFKTVEMQMAGQPFAGMISDADGYLVVGAETNMPEGPFVMMAGINSQTVIGSARIAARPSTPQVIVDYNQQTGMAAINAVERGDSF